MESSICFANVEIVAIQTASFRITYKLQSQTKELERLYNLTVVHFNPEKREFSLLLNIPRPPCSMLGYNRTITRTNINVLINIGPGAGGGRKRRGKKGNLPNTLTMIYCSCWDCNDFYNGKTKRQPRNRKTEHFFKALAINELKSAIAGYIKSTGYDIKWDHFEMLSSGKS